MDNHRSEIFCLEISDSGDSIGLFREINGSIEKTPCAFIRLEDSKFSTMEELYAVVGAWVTNNNRHLRDLADREWFNRNRRGMVDKLKAHISLVEEELSRINQWSTEQVSDYQVSKIPAPIGCVAAEGAEPNSLILKDPAGTVVRVGDPYGPGVVTGFTWNDRGYWNIHIKSSRP